VSVADEEPERDGETETRGASLSGEQGVFIGTEHPLRRRLAVPWPAHLRSVGVPIGVGAIAVAYAGAGEDLQGHEEHIDAHPVALAICSGPMRDTAAVPTAVELDANPAIKRGTHGGTDPDQ
jgi:hypothetical protein